MVGRVRSNTLGILKDYVAGAELSDSAPYYFLLRMLLEKEAPELKEKYGGFLIGPRRVLGKLGILAIDMGYFKQFH